MNQLDRYIDLCLFDTRDVMLAAEYETVAGSELSRRRDFSKPFANSEIE
ncbi:MAG: hypothetical protein KDB27_09100 [Planctomycetales bacterium]|nr:hypothetical protein [Planctomycetales bacterium]